MRITNKMGLPASVVKLVSGGERTFGPKEVSVTTLIKPPQIVWLESQHEDEIVEDAADRIWAAYGSLIHLALERIGGENALVEEKLSIPVGGWTVFGTPDHYEDGVLSDFKFTSVWTTADGVKPDWVTQLNYYAYMLRQHGFPVERAQIVSLYRDWSKTRAMSHDYPQQQVGLHEVPLWEDAFTHIHLAAAVAQYELAQAGEFRECSPDERWHRPGEWAVTKAGNKRATRLLETEDEAAAWAADNTPAGKSGFYFITERPGVDARCQSYCRVGGKLDLCQQWMKVRDAKDQADHEDLPGVQQS